MPELIWDSIGDRVYETGLDKGVLYLPDGSAVPWNGLTSVIEKFDRSGAPVYHDGMKINELVVLGDFSATMKAITYPDEFVEVEGNSWLRNGILVGDQQPKTFGLCYRTHIGNDLEGDKAGYKIHIVYNVTAVPNDKAYMTTSVDPDIIEFEWNIVAIPEECPGIRPTAHVVLDSRDLDPWLLEDLEDKLYGATFGVATLIPMNELISYVREWCRIHITDNGDGSWTATTIRDELLYFYFNAGKVFKIIEANVTYLDPITYSIIDTADIQIVDNGDGTWVARSDVDRLITYIYYSYEEEFQKFTINQANVVYLDIGKYVITDTCDITDVPEIKIVDNGDGTWSATTANDDLFTIDADNYFQITNANAVFVEQDLYRVSNSKV